MTATDELPDLPGIDKGEGLRRMMNKSGLYAKVLRDFHTRFLNELPTRRAHSAKGLAGTIGATDLRKTALALETALHDRDPSLEDYFTEFKRELDKVLTSIAQGFGIAPDN